MHKEGLFKFLKKCCTRLRCSVFSYHPLYLYATDNFQQRNLQAKCPIEIRKGSLKDIDLIIELLGYLEESFAQKRAENAFNKGAEPFLVFSEDRLTHVSWLWYHPGIREQLVNVKLKANEGHIATCYTAPDFRGNNIYPVVLQHILKYAANKNMSRVYISSAPKNVASIRGIEKAGFTKISTIRGFRLFGKMFNIDWESK